MKDYDLLSGKRKYGFLGCKTKIGQVWFRTIRPRWQPRSDLARQREEGWNGHTGFPGALVYGIWRWTVAHAEKKRQENTHRKESPVGRKQG